MIDLHEKRMVCEVLDSMRACHETRNYAGLAGLIAQVQDYVNRMESGLSASRITSYDAYDLIKARKYAKAMNAIETRWPKIKDRT